jgi:hypothetical protein
MDTDSNAILHESGSARDVQPTYAHEAVSEKNQTSNIVHSYVLFAQLSMEKKRLQQKDRIL